MKIMREAQFKPGDINNKAFVNYSNSDIKFYKDNELYYIYGLGYELIGSIKDVEEFLESMFE